MANIFNIPLVEKSISVNLKRPANIAKEIPIETNILVTGGTSYLSSTLNLMVAVKLTALSPTIISEKEMLRKGINNINIGNALIKIYS